MSHQNFKLEDTINSANMANHFEELPDELVIKIIKMVTNHQQYHPFDVNFQGFHEILARTIANISGTNCIKIGLPGKLILSKRKGLGEVLFSCEYYLIINFPGRPIFIQLPPVNFRRIASDKSLWKGTVKIKKVEGIIDFFNDGVNNLFMNHTTSMTSDEILRLAEKCPNMRSLWYPAISSWPTLGTPWYSLKYLGINLDSNNIFDNVELHSSLPNLMYLDIRGNWQSRHHRITLPDMRGCNELRIVILGDGSHFWSPDGIIPFPPGLRRLETADIWGQPAIINLNDLEVEYFRNCTIRNVNFS